MKGTEDKRWTIVILMMLCGIAVASTLLMLYLTRNGGGLGGDGIYYIEGARNILGGRGYTGPYDGQILPITNFPPFFSLTLAGLGLVGFEPLAAERWLSACLLGINILLTSMIMLRFTRTHWMASIIGAALLGSSWQLMQLSYTIMSEPLFIALFLLGLLALLRYLEKPTLGWLLISALIFGLALFTRLMGVPLVGAACLVLLLYDERPWRDRLFRTVLFGAVAGLLLAGFMLRNIMVTGHATNRAFLNAAGLPPHFWRNLAGGLPFWAVPPWLDFKGIFKSVMRLSGAGIVASILIAIAMAWQILVRREKLFKMFFIFFGCYFWFYVAMSAWERWDVGLDYHRLLAPIIPLGIIMAAHAISVAADESKRGRWLGILAISCGLLVMLCCLKTLSAWMHYVEKLGGFDYTQRKWRTSETMKYVGAQLRNAEIYSPDPTAIFHYTRINARHLPYEFSTASGLTADAARLADYISTLRNVLLAGNGYIVYFKISEHNDQYLNMQDIKQDHYFQKIADFPDGEIWAAVR